MPATDARAIAGQVMLADKHIDPWPQPVTHAPSRETWPAASPAR